MQVKSSLAAALQHSPTSFPPSQGRCGEGKGGKWCSFLPLYLSVQGNNASQIYLPVQCKVITRQVQFCCLSLGSKQGWEGRTNTCDAVPPQTLLLSSCSFPLHLICWSLSPMQHYKSNLYSKSNARQSLSKSSVSDHLCSKQECEGETNTRNAVLLQTL